MFVTLSVITARTVQETYAREDGAWEPVVVMVYNTRDEHGAGSWKKYALTLNPLSRDKGCHDS